MKRGGGGTTGWEQPQACDQERGASVAAEGRRRAMEAASPDLSLHISLPSSASGPGPSGGGRAAVGGAGGGGGGGAGGGDPWRRLNGSTASTELSLSPPAEQEHADALPWRHRPSAAAVSSSAATTSVGGAALMMPAAMPMPMLQPLDGGGGLAGSGGGGASVAPPIRGIPIYSGPGGFPFLPPATGADGGPLHHHHQQQQQQKLGFYGSYHPSTWPSSLGSTSPSPSPLAPGTPPPSTLDPASAFLSSPAAHHHHHRMLSASGRLNGMLTDTLRGYGGSGVVGGLGGIVGGHHHHHHHLHGAQPFGLGSRFMPKLPAKRSMRAPRMRWTSTLHARFVHAVELLGGHESACPRPS